MLFLTKLSHRQYLSAVCTENTVLFYLFAQFYYMQN